MRPRRILRNSPWLTVGCCSAVAGGLLLAAGVSSASSLSKMLAVLGLSSLGAAAAFVFDESGTGIADATPSGRPYRLAWRLILLAIPVMVGVFAVLLLDGVDPSSRWPQLLPLALGAPVVGVSMAAGLRAADREAPGALAAPVTLFALVVLILVEPLRRWVSFAPLGEGAHVSRTTAVWFVTAMLCSATTAACVRDPGQGSVRGHNNL